MPSQSDLKSAIERLPDNASSADREILQNAMLTGRITRGDGENSVAISDDRTASTLISDGDNQHINIQLDNISYGELRNLIFPEPPGIAPPLPDPLFIEREEVMTDVKALLGIPNGAAVRAPFAIVQGWPGVGKTTLVSILARDLAVAQAYPDGVLWASLDQNPALMSILASWGRALGRNDLLKAATLQEAAQQLTVTLQRKRMLLIVDDVWEASHALLFRSMQGPQCGMLITSRLPEVARSIAQNEQSVYRLPVLTEKGALKLMWLLVPQIVEQHENDCLALINDLEYLPLALHVAGRLLRAESNKGWGVKDLLAEIRVGAKVLEAQAVADSRSGGQIPTVQVLLQKNTDLLSDYSRECFAYLGPFAPKPATFDLAAMKAVWQVDDACPIVRDLIDHGLLEPVGNNRFQMHALLVAHARSLCEA